MADAENHLLPGGTNDSWRTWLMTGARRGRVDRRRLRGAHRGLKRMLIEGMGDWTERPYSWNEFSGAMVRHAVDEALRGLPDEDRQLVKLAYFGGLTNGEIAHQSGLTVATVQRRLRRALTRISEHVQRGRGLARRAVYALVVWFSARSVSDAVHQAVQMAAVATAAAIIVAQPALPAPASSRSSSPVTRGQLDSGGASSAQRAARPAAPAPAGAATVAAPTVPVVGQTVVAVPIQLPSVPVSVPSVKTVTTTLQSALRA